MDFADQIAALASRIPQQLEHLRTEEATKNALVLPFINALGYNVFDPTEVVPEFTADHGTKKGEKVDYAICQDGEPLILFECKRAGDDLNVNHAGQLFRYFHVTPARVGVLTNGLVYRFFSDLEEQNKMDERPFLEVDMTALHESQVEELKRLRKNAFDVEELLSAAHELKYTKALRGYLSQQWSGPDDAFVRFMTGQVYDGRITQSVREQFAGIVKRALHGFVNDRISDRLQIALREDDAGAAPSPKAEPEEEAPQEESGRSDVETTQEEMEAFYIVRAILREVVDVERVAHRDVKSYFGILLDDNNRQPLCRLHFNTQQRYLGLFDEDKNEERVPLDSLNDIYQHADRIRATVKLYE